MTYFITWIVLCLWAWSLVACAGDGTNMVEETQVQTTTITWVDQIPMSCAGSEFPVGCAIWTPDHKGCTVIMPKDSPDWVVAHEVRHCFGYRH